MKKSLLKRFIIFLVVLISCFLTYYFLSEGRPAFPDSSRYRNLLYSYIFLIMPLIILCDVIYLFSCLVKAPIKTALISLILGVSAPLLLFYSVKSSKDPMASMAFIGIVVFYAVASMIIFVMLSIGQWLIEKYRKV